jgi:hypothetical protein
MVAVRSTRKSAGCKATTMRNMTTIAARAIRSFFSISGLLNPPN